MYECVHRRPFGRYAYFADNEHVPYGSLNRSQITALARVHFNNINKLNPIAAVAACNTVTAECIEELRANFTFPIVGIQPAVKPAAKNASKCAVLATPATAKSSALRSLVKEYGRGITFVAECPDLAAYIEQNIFSLDKKEVEARLPALEADAVVLGCTHYSFVSDIIARHYSCAVFDGAEGTVTNLLKILGIFDHRNNCPLQIAFYGGNSLKNRQIFIKMLNKQL